MNPTHPDILTDPMLQLPGEGSVRVVWFTRSAGTRHEVDYGDTLSRTCRAESARMSRMLEDHEFR